MKVLQMKVLQMKSVQKILMMWGLMLVASVTNAAGLLRPTNAQLPELTIKEHHVDVVIESGYVTTSIEQVFGNPHNQDLDALYSFPVPEKAAVGEFTYWIDGLPVTGEVVRKQKARKIYEQQKAAGQEVALVEKNTYKTFDISVSPVRAQSDVRIRLVYIQAVHVDLGVGRYLYPLEDGGVDEAALAFWSRNEAVSEKFSFNLRLKSGYPLEAIRLPKHPSANIQQVSAQEWTVSLVNDVQQRDVLQGTSGKRDGQDKEKRDKESRDKEETVQINEAQINEVTQTSSTNLISPTASVIKLNQDIAVYWRLQDGLPGSVDMQVYREEGKVKGTFMMTLTPGDDLAPIYNGSDWVFVLDISGSMQGKYATLVEGVRQGLDKLRPEDRFRVVLFNNSATELSRGYLPATKTNVERMITSLSNHGPNGGTNLYEGMKKGLKGLDSDRPTAMILVTDGVANVGVTEKEGFLTLLERYDVRLFTFVMGNSANRPLLQSMTDISNGFAVSISNSDDIIGQLMLAVDKMTHQAFRDVSVHINGGGVADVTPQKLQTLYRGEQLVVMGHYFKSGNVTVTMKGKIGAEKKQYQTTITLPDIDESNPELERLWAFEKIEQLQSQIDYLGEDSDIKQAMVETALEYGLVTDFTSMIVVRDEVFQQQGIARNNKKRVEKEQNARNVRQQQQAKPARVDSHQPMFSSPRASGGGGSINTWLLFVMLGALYLRLQLVTKR